MRRTESDSHSPGQQKSVLFNYTLLACWIGFADWLLGATVGALVATLPVSAGPVYVFLALDHDASFISTSAIASLALNAATAIFVTVYVLAAQRHSLWSSVS